MQHSLVKAAVTLSLFVSVAVHAQGVRDEKNISLDLATQIAAQAVATCSANGYAVTATVVDRAGTVRAVQRADDSGPHTIDSSRLKAYTAVSARESTSAMMERVQKNPAAANLTHIPGYLLLGGGVPVKVNNYVIGAVGVGGAPGGHLDDQCAVAGIAKVQSQLK